ncbi:exonuclease SbcCD subunit D [Fusibacter sp. JL298sf-3]
MKFIHTSDWHIGKLVCGLHMTEDQNVLLEQLAEYLAKTKPDALLISGDIYDRTIPPVEAVAVLNRFLKVAVSDLEIPVVMTSGNHDSAERLGFGSELLKSQGLYVVTSLAEALEPIELGPSVEVFAIPYVEPLTARYFFDDESIQTQADCFEALVKVIQTRSDSSKRQILMAHGLFLGNVAPEMSDSERPLSVGGLDYVDASTVAGFDYVALGHLHKAQQVGAPHIRYAGSLMKYSFSEDRHEKGLLEVTLPSAGAPTVEKIRFTPPRDLRTIQGDIRHLLSEDVYKLGCREDYLRVVLTDEGAVYDPVARLRRVYPNLLKLEYATKVARPSTQQSIAYKKHSPYELFEAFFEHVTDTPLSDAQETFAKSVVEETIKKERVL